MNEKVKNSKEPKDGIFLIKKYEDLLKGAYKKIKIIMGKHEELLKRFKERDEFFVRVGLSRSNICFVPLFPNIYFVPLFLFVWIILSSVESFIRGEFYSCRIFSSLENFIH